MIDLSDSDIFKFEISYLITNFFILLSFNDISSVFEFLMYAGRDTHRFRRQYYKSSALKRHFMLTVFDETLINESKYKKQLKIILWSNVVIKTIALILFILRCIFTFKKSIPIWFTVIYSICFVSEVIFGCWVIAHRADDWRGWIKGGLYLNDFYMPLPDEKPK